jgi:hypothetical protein
MKDKVRASKRRKTSRPTDTNFAERMAELRKLREQVRLAEMAIMSPGDDTPQVARL